MMIIWNQISCLIIIMIKTILSEEMLNNFINIFSVLRMNCLLIRPRWMWEERDVIGNTPLHSLMLPGTHNSGSFIPKGSSVSMN
jgi:hypothetical protein